MIKSDPIQVVRELLPPSFARPRAGWLLPALLLGAAAPASAQICAPTDPVFLAEGPVSAATYNPTDGSGTITAMGVTFRVTPQTPVSTPTAALNMERFADSTPFPGRSQGGFLGATVIATGCVKFEAGVPVAVADDVFSDVSENVVLGVVTAPLVDGSFAANGQPVSLLTDSRMPAHPISNAFGFAVTPESMTVNTNVALEGYYGNQDPKKLNVWAVELDGGQLVDSGPQISIQRYRCTNDIELRGGIYPSGGACNFGAPLSLALFDGNNNPIPFVAKDLVVTNGIAPAAEFCAYRLRPAVSQCPASVRVELRLNGSKIAEATAP